MSKFPPLVYAASLLFYHFDRRQTRFINNYFKASSNYGCIASSIPFSWYNNRMEGCGAQRGATMMAGTLKCTRQCVSADIWVLSPTGSGGTEDVWNLGVRPSNMYHANTTSTDFEQLISLCNFFDDRTCSSKVVLSQPMGTLKRY